MNKNNFLNDAARYGAVLGLVQVVFGALSTLVAAETSGWETAAKATGQAMSATPASTGNQLLLSLVTIASLAVFIILLLRFTRRRADMVTANGAGFSFGDGLKYILGMAFFSALVYTVWEILSRNVIFREWNAYALDQSLDILSASFNSSSAMPLEELVKSTREAFYSPMIILVSVIMSLMLKSLFFGVFVALKTRREPNIFINTGDNE